MNVSHLSHFMSILRVHFKFPETSQLIRIVVHHFFESRHVCLVIQVIFFMPVRYIGDFNFSRVNGSHLSFFHWHS